VFPHVTKRLGEVDVREYSAGAALAALSLWLNAVGEVARRRPEELPEQVVTDSASLPSAPSDPSDPSDPSRLSAASPATILVCSPASSAAPRRDDRRGFRSHGNARLPKRTSRSLSLRPQTLLRLLGLRHCSLQRSPNPLGKPPPSFRCQNTFDTFHLDPVDAA